MEREKESNPGLILSLDVKFVQKYTHSAHSTFFFICPEMYSVTPWSPPSHRVAVGNTVPDSSVSDPYSLNPDPDLAENFNPDPSYFLPLSETNFFNYFIVIRFSYQKKSIE